MNGDMQSTEAVGCKNTSIGEYSAFERSPRMSGGARSANEYVDLSNANIGKNLMPQKPKGSFARIKLGKVLVAATLNGWNLNILRFVDVMIG
ncbi:hypothetical protein CQW23_14318 [Capsicum baccatum]|uniref:Uncharacterized protein n=1 Tax=Capsicum baccatum TaxID=33114 RepID=A0A2G2WJ35_CAPBA|nr:hypothetical protein CQW23_14318 [Capsicum baccatum]